MRPDIGPHQVRHILKKDSDFDRLLNAYEELFELYLQRSDSDYEVEFSETHITNIAGVGVSRHMIQGVDQDHVGLKIMLRVATQEIKGVRPFPAEIGGVPVHAEVVGRATPSAVFTAKKRPAPGGYSIGNAANSGSGTLGCLVTYGGKTGILSNWHVLDDVRHGTGKTIIQPGPDAADGGASPADDIGALAYSVPPIFIASAHGECDAAIAAVGDASDVSKTLAKTATETYAVGAGTGDPSVDLLVQKSGRTTGYTKGKVKAIGVTIDVGPYANGKTGHFTNVFTVQGSSGAWAAGGDSGSLVTQQADAKPVGLHFADGGGLGYECEIKKVLAALGASAGDVTIQSG